MKTKTTQPYKGMTRQDRLKNITTAPYSKGKTILLKYYKGEEISRSQAITAKCCDCMCYHVDGRIDCLMPHCPLYPWRPYKKDPEPPITGETGPSPE